MKEGEGKEREAPTHLIKIQNLPMPHALLNIASGYGWWLTLQLQVCTYLSTCTHMYNLRCTYARASTCVHVGGEIDK